MKRAKIIFVILRALTAGLVFEYLVRVEFNPFALFCLVALIAGLIIDIIKTN